MSEFLAVAFGFPTVFFTVLLILVVLYWLTVLLGAADLDLLDGVLDLDGDFDIDGGVEVEGGDVDADVGDLADGDAGDTGSGLAGLVRLLGLAGVPLTISLSLLVLFGWILTYVASDLSGAGGWLAGLVLLLSTGLALALTSFSIRPLRPVFKIETAPRHRDLVGSVCLITTGRVGSDFGQAEVANPDGAPLLLQVRCHENDNGLGRGSEALIFDYDPRRQVFLVSPLDPALAALHSAG